MTNAFQCLGQQGTSSFSSSVINPDQLHRLCTVRAGDRYPKRVESRATTSDICIKGLDASERSSNVMQKTEEATTIVVSPSGRCDTDKIHRDVFEPLVLARDISSERYHQL